MNRQKAAFLVLLVLVFLVAAVVPASAVGSLRRLVSVSFSDPLHGIASGGRDSGSVLGGFVLRTADGGLTWSQETTNANWIKSVAAAPGGGGIAVPSTGKTVLSAAGLTSGWTPSAEITASGNFLWYGSAMADAQRGWVVGRHQGPSEPAAIYGTEDGGRTWTMQFEGPFYPAPSPEEDPPAVVASLVSVQAAPGTTSAWAVGSQIRKGGESVPLSLIYHTTDGRTWTQQAVAGGRDILDVSAVDASTAVAISRYGYLYKTTDGGANWAVTRPLTLYSAGTAYSICFVSATVGWVATDSGLIYKTTDGGATWVKQTSGVKSILRDITFSGPNLGWAVGDDEVVLRTANGGTTWTKTLSLVKPVVSLRTSASVVRYGYGATLSGSISAPRPASIAIDYLPAGQTEWRQLATVAAGTTGAYSYAPRKSTAKVSYRARYVGGVGYYDAVSPVVSVTPQVRLVGPYAPSTAYRGRYFTVYGFLQPRHTAGSYPVKVYAYRYEGGKWVYRGVYSAKAANYSTYTRFSRSIRLPYAGKWRLRAYAPADASHAATYSGYRYLTVK